MRDWIPVIILGVIWIAICLVCLIASLPEVKDKETK